MSEYHSSDMRFSLQSEKSFFQDAQVSTRNSQCFYTVHSIVLVFCFPLSLGISHGENEVDELLL